MPENNPENITLMILNSGNDKLYFKYERRGGKWYCTHHSYNRATFQPSVNVGIRNPVKPVEPSALGTWEQYAQAALYRYLFKLQGMYTSPTR